MKNVLVVELSAGQMIEDVRLAVGAERPIHFYSRVGGMLVSPEEVIERTIAILEDQEVSHG